MEPLQGTRPGVVDQVEQRWGAFELRPDTLNKFKSILERDVGAPLPWNDDQIKEIAHNVLHLLDVLASLANPAEASNNKVLK